MKKFAANYVISDTGIFLKNGIIVAEEKSISRQFIDTKGDLREIALLSFFNGILIGEFTFIKSENTIQNPSTNLPVQILISKFIAAENNTTVRGMIELSIKIQEQFPERNISEIWSEISDYLINRAGFEKQLLPGIFLLSGINLPEMKFKPGCNLKKIF